MRKKIGLFAIVLLLLTVSVTEGASEQWTAQDLRNALENRAELQTKVGAVNGILASFPSYLVNFLLGEDRVYHVRVDGTSLGVVVRGGRIASMSTGAPSAPTHNVDTSYGTLLGLVNTDSPVREIVNALMSGGIRLYKVPACAGDFVCRDNEVCTVDGCKSAFTVAVVPLGYSAGEKSLFESKAGVEAELMRDYLPVSGERVRFHYVSPSICPNVQCDDACVDCQGAALDCTRRAGLAGVADRVAAVSKDDTRVHIGGGQYIYICGCAGGIPAYTSVTKSRFSANGGTYCVKTLTHEVGHTLGLYHVDATGQEGGACLGPNAEDCGDSRKMTDLMGYGTNRDHFGPSAVTHLQNVLSGRTGG